MRKAAESPEAHCNDSVWECREGRRRELRGISTTFEPYILHESWGIRAMPAPVIRLQRSPPPEPCHVHNAALPLLTTLVPAPTEPLPPRRLRTGSPPVHLPCMRSTLYVRRQPRPRRPRPYRLRGPALAASRAPAERRRPRLLRPPQPRPRRSSGALTGGRGPNCAVGVGLRSVSGPRPRCTHACSPGAGRQPHHWAGTPPGVALRSPDSAPARSLAGTRAPGTDVPGR